jgi:hypothetical protein
MTERVQTNLKVLLLVLHETTEVGTVFELYRDRILRDLWLWECRDEKFGTKTLRTIRHQSNHSMEMNREEKI